MNSKPASAGGPLVELSDDQCRTLLAQHTIARIAWQGTRGPTVIPVNYAYDGERIRIRTAAYSALARECDDSVVAIEVDQIDEDGRFGWSVLLRGHCQIDFERSGTRRDRWDDVPDAEPWPAGHHPLQLVVEPYEVHGRRVVPFEPKN
ncbi:pyridoxamine 5'-phosphate oxidase family protein [Nocardioides sp. GXZ039]|uniref:pyridoxamine 5'-phosphate oxidase family protein n=1 Tax=Nocardioides sp. GXZ039 TaxID=3136018 RepID=UPI0030F3F75A